jgi:hypothetical protein
MAISRQSIRRLINEEVRKILREGAEGISGHFDIVDPSGHMPKLAFYLNTPQGQATGNIVGSQSLVIAIIGAGSSLSGEKKEWNPDWGSPSHQDYMAGNAAALWSNYLATRYDVSIDVEDLKQAFLSRAISISFKEAPRNTQVYSGYYK